MNGKIQLIMAAMLIFSLAGIASAEDPTPSINICTKTPATCATQSTLVVYKDTDASVSPGLYAHFADWISGTPGSIWVVDSIGGGATVYGPVAVSITNNPTDALYGWTPDGVGDLRYKIYAHATQDPDGPGLFADVTVRTRANSTPELPTSALMSVGLIGLLGMVYMRRKN